MKPSLRDWRFRPSTALAEFILSIVEKLAPQLRMTMKPSLRDWRALRLRSRSLS
jgi:hypothetical protein